MAINKQETNFTPVPVDHQLPENSESEMDKRPEGRVNTGTSSFEYTVGPDGSVFTKREDAIDAKEQFPTQR